MSVLLLYSRCLIGVVFAIAVVSKLRAPGAFVTSVRQVQVLPAAWAPPVAVALVAGETAVVLAMVRGPLAGFAGAILLLGGFTAAVAVAMRRGIPAICRCFGTAGAPFGRRHVVRNLALIVCAGAGALLAAAGAADVTGRMLALAVPAAVLSAAAVTRLDDLMFLFRPARPRIGPAPAVRVRAARPTGTR
ncbi:MauE/DoxX family redox-associated membrane protein [Dactylosporangium sp. NPDC000521]|uniref:MauE/DoxX family redox-associated membrane protein n=1 Tax=Dactylosporangium sp. NPDC000521 TaxID=3363975 RepID=UPI0036845B21